MTDETRVRQLLELLLETRGTPEDVCREHPELLDEVRRRWERMRALEAHVEDLFPRRARRARRKRDADP